MVKVNMPPVPVVVPVRIMTCDDVIAKAGKALIQLPCDFRTRRLCTSATHLMLCVRWVPKRGEPGSRALKVRNTIWHAHSAKADATSTAANSMCDLSATMEPTCLEAATPEWPLPPNPPPPADPPSPPPPWPAAHPALARAIDVMPTKLSSFNFFILQDRDSSVSRPLRVSGVL